LNFSTNRIITFSKICLSCCGPFSDHQDLIFRDGLNAISSAPGLGKTTTFNQLKYSFSSRKKELGIDSDALDNLVFVSEEPSLSWHILYKDLLNCLEKVGVQRNQVDHEISEYLKKIINEEFSAFFKNETEYSLENSAAKVEGLGCIGVHDNKIENISSIFSARSEKIALHFSIILACRKLLNLRYPLVCDGIFYGLDSRLCSRLFSAVTQLDCQVILLDYPSIFEKLEIKPTVELAMDSGGRSSIITQP